ncbi:DUF2156 domain-containing protein [Streptomyces sp. NPDC007346]|uniref:bifunctional lysylphosphatidylglycerol flippase/synthetase MprF n=1 Tax=Streptomyces sp. NPDC007346 TaxID=3154682 RepID=UPI0034573055
MTVDPVAAATDPAELLRAHADHPSAFLALNSRTRHYSGRGAEGLIAYRRAGRFVAQFGGPFAAPGQRAALLDEFLGSLRASGGRARLTAVQLRAQDVRLYEDRGFTVNRIGSSYSIDLTRFTLSGKPLAKVRQNVSRARREGCTVTEVSGSEHSLRSGLDALDAAWLRAKGRHVKELRFLIGERGGPGAPLRRTFVARRDGRTLGYITYSPAWGSRPGWLYDLTRREPDAPCGTVELINLTAVQRFQEEGAQWLHLGLTPFASLDTEPEPASASPVLTRAVRLLGTHGGAVYPARSQEAFKRKWAPHSVDPEYAAFQGGVRPLAVWRLLRLTGAV